MKSDYYLNLCLEQAALSPLHFRHGCVVVKGGKVIGQGFNDYRPGYDGGALKTGRLSSRASPLASDAHSRTKNPPGAKRDFTAFETVGGTTRGAGPHGTVGLSMHSEMMAIHSALASSSTLAASTVSYIKPSLKLPGDYKHKLRDAVRSYTERVCLEAVGQHVQQGTGTTQTDEWRFDTPTPGRDAPASSSYPSAASEGEWGEQGQEEREQERQQEQE